MALYEKQNRQPRKEHHVAVYLSDDMVQELVAYAEMLDTRVSPLIRMAVAEKIEKLKDQFGEREPHYKDITFASHASAPSTPSTLFNKPATRSETVVSSQHNDERASKEFQDNVTVDTSKAMNKPIAGGLKW